MGASSQARRPVKFKLKQEVKTSRVHSLYLIAALGQLAAARVWEWAGVLDEESECWAWRPESWAPGGALAEGSHWPPGPLRHTSSRRCAGMAEPRAA